MHNETKAARGADARDPDDIFDSGYSWARLLVTMLIAIAGGVGIWSYIAVLPSVQAQFDIGRGEASIPYVFSMIGFAVGSVVVGRAVDRFGVVISVCCAATLLGLSYALATIAPNFVFLTAIHFLIGCGSSASFAPVMADISHWFMRRRGVAVALTASGNYFAGALWPWALSDLLADEGWKAVYLALAVMVPVLSIPLALLLRRRPPAGAMNLASQRAQTAAMTAGFTPRQLQILLCVAGIGCCVAMSMPQVHIIAYCVDLGYGAGVGTQMLSLMLLGGVCSRIASGMLSDVIGGVKTLLIGSLLQCTALFLYIPFDGLTSLFVVSAIFGLSQGGLVPSYAIIVREYLPPAEAGARVGIVIMSTIVGMALGGWMSGWIYDVTGSYGMAFLNGIAFNLINLAIVLTLIYRSRPHRPRGAPAAA
ncbi:MFS transporter [Pikeienuella sp. HZG-20]|uniref:MFS transporter n=1 Tax=Paludibacillus litoralis TaxID=3133267 RepID=UPI0030EDF12C